MKRNNTRVIKVGDVLIGGTNPISIQSMCNTQTKDVDSTVRQILEMEKYGLDIIRFAVNDLEDAEAATCLRNFKEFQLHLSVQD